MKIIALGFFVAISLGSSSGFASGFSMASVCSPVLEETGPKIEFVTVSMRAPGGRASEVRTISIDGSAPLKELSAGKYQKGLKVSTVPLESPSGSVFSSVMFVSLKPGRTGFSELSEVLYKCD